MSTFFSALGTARQAFLGRPATANEVRWTPWLKSRDLPLEWMAFATEVAEIDRNADLRAKEAAFDLAMLVQAEEHAGSTRLPLDCLEQAIGYFGPQAEERWRARNIIRVIEAGAHAALNPGGLLRVDNHCVYSARLLALEDAVVFRLKQRIAADDVVSAEAIAEATAACRFAPEPSASQLAAIHLAARRRLAVITGGPGTGKTTVVQNLLRLVRQLHPAARVVLAAPTGKAAHRLQSAAEGSFDEGAEVTLEPAKTLHRLLGFSPRTHRFRHDAEHPVEADLVIVDEASMVDLWLMAHLLEAVSPEASLVLLGDADQLPSVDAGQVLKDVTGRVPHTAVLKDNFRMRSDDEGGRHLAECAALAHRGSADLFDAVKKVRRPDQLTFSGVNWLDVKPDAVYRLLERFDNKTRKSHERDRAIYRVVQGELLPEHETRARELLHEQSRARILTLTRQPSFDRGATAANRRLHAMRALKLGLFEAPEFLPSEPVIVQRNDYERGLFNGDQGVVLRLAVDEDPVQPYAVFEKDGELIWMPLDRLSPQLELGHATTVHRAQGSEFDHVLILMPERDLALSTRELLYTALTRARKSATVVGSKTIISAALGRVVRRNSGIAEKLGAAP